jgi:carboxylesterase type B
MQLDLWKPKTTSQPLPAILCIHGGGWYKGERSNMANLAQALAAKGFVTATISYRLSGEGIGRRRRCLQAAAAAVVWISCTRR